VKKWLVVALLSWADWETPLSPPGLRRPDQPHSARPGLGPASPHTQGQTDSERLPSLGSIRLEPQIKTFRLRLRAPALPIVPTQVDYPPISKVPGEIRNHLPARFFYLVRSNTAGISPELACSQAPRADHMTSPHWAPFLGNWPALEPLGLRVRSAGQPLGQRHASKNRRNPIGTALSELVAPCGAASFRTSLGRSLLSLLRA